MLRFCQRVLRVLFSLLALAGLLLPVLLALFASENLLLSTLKDDGFYFFTLARNLAHGLGVTFDGLGPTNGFHPLWAFLLTPVFWFPYASLMMPVRIALLLAAALHLAAGIAIYRAARRLTGPEAARLGALAYLGNPLAVNLVVSGMESPLAAFLVAWLAGISIRLRQGEELFRRRREIAAVGLLCGLCVLARTDLILLVGLVLAGYLLPTPETQSSPLRVRLRASLQVAAVATATLLPWILWNLARFGTVIQVSARAHHLNSAASEAASGAGGWVQIGRTGPWLLKRLLGTVSQRTHLPISGVALMGGAAILLCLLWGASLLGRAQVRRDLLRRLRWCDAPVLYGAGFLFATFFILGHLRSWYLAGPLAVAGILSALLPHYALRRDLLSSRLRAVSLLLLAGILISSIPLGVLFGREAWVSASEPDAWWEASEWVKLRTQPDDRVASFNTGAFSYLTPRTVVNLDCVINNRALPWLQRRQLIGYLHQDRIRYLIDHPSYVGFFFSAFAEPDWKEDLVPVDTLRSGLRVYEIR